MGEIVYLTLGQIVQRLKNRAGGGTLREIMTVPMSAAQMEMYIERMQWLVRQGYLGYSESTERYRYRKDYVDPEVRTATAPPILTRRERLREIETVVKAQGGRSITSKEICEVLDMEDRHIERDLRDLYSAVFEAAAAVDVDVGLGGRP